MSNDSASRKWLLTINNPIDKGYSHEKLKEILLEFKSLIYWCMSDEIGENGTFHTHLYLCNSSAVRMSTIKNKIKEAHMDMARGTSSQNRDYVFKEGKWLNDKKSDTNIRDSHEEYGECPVERQGQRNDLNDLYDQIKQGMTNFEIIDSNPENMMRIDKIERARQIMKEEEYKRTWRNVKTTYIWGKTETGKTRYVMEKYGYENVYRVTDYEHPFDGYQGQDVIFFDEFTSSIKIQDMLVYLDGYPVQLPCRYVNKIACYTKVYLASNISLEEQYPNIKQEYRYTWDAFKRRIQEVVYTCKDNTGFFEDEII